MVGEVLTELLARVAVEVEVEELFTMTDGQKY